MEWEREEDTHRRKSLRLRLKVEENSNCFLLCKFIVSTHHVHRKDREQLYENINKYVATYLFGVCLLNWYIKVTCLYTWSMHEICLTITHFLELKWIPANCISSRLCVLFLHCTPAQSHWALLICLVEQCKDRNK